MTYDFMHSPVDQVATEARVTKLATRSIKHAAKMQGLRMIISMCDLTTLEGKDTTARVQQLCARAMHPHPAMPDVPSVAAVCVYPPFVAAAKNALRQSAVKVASVATAFPSGQAPLETRLAEVRACVADGADEIDMVIDRGAFLAGHYTRVVDEMCAVKEACGEAHLKVILETGELGTYDAVRKASMLAMHAGADFIKTSTGKIQPAATLPVTLVMLEAIRDYFLATGRRVGMKPAGGIRTAKDALRYLVLVNETLGDAWLHPAYFRFGASSLVDDVLRQWLKMQSGHYVGDNYITQD